MRLLIEGKAPARGWQLSLGNYNDDDNDGDDDYVYNDDDGSDYELNNPKLVLECFHLSKKPSLGKLFSLGPGLTDSPHPI